MQTNRRSFLRGILVAAVAPSVLLPKFKDTYKWKRTETLWIANPEYVTATHEIKYIFDVRVLSGKWPFVQNGHSVLPLELSPDLNIFQKPVDSFPIWDYSSPTTV